MHIKIDGVTVGLVLFIVITIARIVLKLMKKNYDWTRAAQMITILIVVISIMTTIK